MKRILNAMSTLIYLRTNLMKSCSFAIRAYPLSIIDLDFLLHIILSEHDILMGFLCATKEMACLIRPLRLVGFKSEDDGFA